MSQLYGTNSAFPQSNQVSAPYTQAEYVCADFYKRFNAIDLYDVAQKIEALFAFLQSENCAIVNKEEIKDFLNYHTNIVGYLYEATDIIRGKFGNTKLNLELSFDPEFNDDEGELFLNIETNLGAKEANDKLNEIDREWLLIVARKDIGVFNLNLDFI